VANEISFDVYYDILCPYVNAAALWLREVQRQSPDRIKINWRYFPLEQVNAKDGPDWYLWEQLDSYESRGLLAFRAQIAARRQGDDAFTLMQYALLAARHEQDRDITRRETMRELAQSVDLDMVAFERDLDDRSLMAEIGEDYREGRLQHNVFGTPTFVFPEGATAYLKVLPPPPNNAAVEFFNQFVNTVRNRPYIQEIKRATSA
jgi:predicted DsbA family dithiol-disulfide isomerase